MAEPVIVPVTAKFIDVDTSELNFGEVTKQITKSMSGIKKAINDAFSGIDPSVINKSIDKSMTAVEKSVQRVESAHIRLKEAMVKAGKSSDEYQAAIKPLDALIANFKETLASYESQGFTFLPEYRETKAQLDELIKKRAEIDPIDFVDSAEPIHLEKIANAYKQYLSAHGDLNKKTTEYNQTIKDNRLSDEYQEMLKQAEVYKKKLDELNEKSKRMEALGATDKQWEALRYDTDQVSASLDNVVTKMREAVKTGSALRFGDGPKADLSRQINSLAMSGGNRAGAIRGRAMKNESPYTEEYQKALDDLDKLEKKVQAIKEKSAKMIELGASDKSFASLAYDAKQLSAQVDAAKNRITEMINSGKAFKFGKGDSAGEMSKVSDKSKELKDSLEGVGKNANKSKGKLSGLLKVLGAIGKGFVTVARGATNVAGRLLSSIKNMKLFGKAGHTTSNDLSKKFKKLGRNILMFGLGFRTAYYAVKRLRNIFIEGFQVMGDAFDEVGNPMKALIESFNRLKGSLATAFQPIVSVLMPILTRFMNYLSTMLEKIGAFTATLTGQGHIYKAIAKNINSVAKAAKNANNQLGSYDKLEVIQDNNVGYDYEKQSVGEAQSAASDFAKMVKEAWEKADFTSVGHFVTKKLGEVLDNVKDNIIPDAVDLVNKVLKSVNTFLTAFDATKIGGKVGSILSVIIQGLDWTQLGAVFANLQNTLWGFLKGLVVGINWLDFGQSLSKGVASMFNTLKVADIATTVAQLISGLITVLVEVAPSLAQGLVSAICTVLTTVDWGQLATTLFDGILSILGSIGEAMLGSDNPIISSVGELIASVREGLAELKPAITAIVQALGPIIQAILPVISKLLPPISKIINDVVMILLPPLIELVEALMPSIISLVETLLPVIEAILKRLANDIATAMNVISRVVIPIIDILIGVLDFVISTVQVLGKAFKGEFGSLKDVFSALLQAWKGPINKIIDAFERLVNGLASGINKFIQGLNKIKVPDWDIFGKYAGKSINIPEIPKAKIPRLAQGAVIPPNQEFLAVLGDQKRGTNIEAPLDTIKQAVAEVLAEMGGGSREPIVLQVSGRTLAKVVWDEQEKRYKQTGHAMA